MNPDIGRDFACHRLSGILTPLDGVRPNGGPSQERDGLNNIYNSTTLQLYNNHPHYAKENTYYHA